MSELLPLLLGLVVGLLAGVATAFAVQRRSTAAPAGLAAERAAVDALVRPVNDTLARVSLDLSRAERDRAAAHAQLQEQIRLTALGTDALRDQTGRLVTALPFRGARPVGRGAAASAGRVVGPAPPRALRGAVEQP